MRNWSHGLMFAALVSFILVVSLAIVACDPEIDVDVDHPKVHSTKTHSVKPGKVSPKKPAFKAPSAPRFGKRK